GTVVEAARITCWHGIEVSAPARLRRSRLLLVGSTRGRAGQLDSFTRRDSGARLGRTHSFWHVRAKNPAELPLTVEQRGRNREEADCSWPDTNGPGIDVKQKMRKYSELRKIGN